MNLWLQISLCGLFLLAVNACDDLNIPVIEVPPVHQIPRENISESLIRIINDECPSSFVELFRKYLNEIRDNNTAESVKKADDLADFGRNSARFYAENDLVTIQSYKPPSVIPRYMYRELAFRKSQLFSDEYATGEKLIATPQEILDSWMNKPYGRPATYDYDLYGKEPMEADAEKYEYFTQLVWGSTHEFGLACVTSRRTFTSNSSLGVENNLNQTTTKIVLNVVANFRDRGNNECEYRQNVLPRRDSVNKEHQELISLYEKKKLLPTRKCQSRDEFYPSMTQCPKKFEDNLLKLFKDMRKKRTNSDMHIDHSNLGAYSQEYANWLVGQSHEVIGNEPNNRHGGDIVWWPKKPIPGQLSSYNLEAGEFMKHVTEQEKLMEEEKLIEEEIDGDVANQFKDFTRIVWKNSNSVGFGCALAWLPGQNITRPIVVVNFYRSGNQPGHYKANVLKQTEHDHAEENGEIGDDESIQGSGRDQETSSPLPESKQEEDVLELV